MITQQCLNCGEDVSVRKILHDMYNPEGFYTKCSHCGATFDIDWGHLKEKMFIDDPPKMDDFKELSKEDFLESYDYLTSEEYDVTELYFNWLIS